MPTKGYSLYQAAKKLGISPQAVLKAIRAGRLKAKLKFIKRPQKTWVIDPKSLKDYTVSSSHQERGLKNP